VGSKFSLIYCSLSFDKVGSAFAEKIFSYNFRISHESEEAMNPIMISFSLASLNSPASLFSITFYGEQYEDTKQKRHYFA
jgi:hypothetical protein